MTNQLSCSFNCFTLETVVPAAVDVPVASVGRLLGFERAFGLTQPIGYLSVVYLAFS